MNKYLDNNGLLYVWGKVKALVNGKVDKAEGKGLSTNDYTNEDKASLAGKLDKSGGVMSGAITLPGAPSSDLHAATKKYVDDKMTAAVIGDMMKSTYDADNDGVVDNAKRVNGHTVAADVPAGAKFTDTVYSPVSAGADGLMTKEDFTKLAAFSPAAEYAKKSDISTMYRYKGSKANADALPAEGNKVGDVWNVEDTNMNYGWTGSAWDPLGQVFEIAAITNAEIDTITAG